MRVVACAANFESLDNYVDAFRLINNRGGQCELLLINADSKANAHTIGQIGLRYRIVDRASLDSILQRVVDEDPDIVFQCDSHSTATSLVTQVLRQRQYRGLILAGTGRIAQPAPKTINADRMLCYGHRHIGRLKMELRVSTYESGLPRLDRVRGLSTSEGGYIVYLAHRSPDVPVVNATLSAVEKQFRLPVIVSDHPDYPGLYPFKSALPPPASVSGQGSALQLIQHCNLVIATDATAVLDAIYLGKSVVLLPNAGLPMFDGYPGISDGFSPILIQEAAKRVKQNPDAVSEFLNEVVGGVRHDHCERVLSTLQRLVTSGPLRKIAGMSVSLETSSSTDNAVPKISTRVELARLVPPGGKAAELGVAKGVFSDELLHANDKLHLYSIDRWAGDRGHDNTEYSDTCALLSKHASRSTIVRKAFDEALADFQEGSLDLVYIDGYAHDGQQGGETLKQWWSRVKPGGIFAGHDYHPDWKPTMDAVDGFCRKHGLVIQTTSDDFFPSWYVRKPAAE
jgi:hypothetical protein